MGTAARGAVAVALVVVHPSILFIVRPELLALLNSITASWRARFAALSTYSLIALVVTSWTVFAVNPQVPATTVPELAALLAVPPATFVTSAVTLMPVPSA